MRILLTGATGTLGRRLTPALRQLGSCLPLGFTSAPEGGLQLDLTDAAATRALLERERPDLILHAAAQANVDECERDPDGAYRLNVLATRHLSDWALAAGPRTRFVYISTDHVYDSPGESAEEEVCPVNVYALTKLWAEGLASRLDDSLVLRTDFFGLGQGRRPSFVDWIVDSCLSGREITLFRDVFFNPLQLDDLVELIVELIGREARGVLNLGSAGGGMSKGDFIRQVVQHLALPSRHLREGALADAALFARRPRDMRMSLARVEALLGRPTPSLSEGIARLRLNARRDRAS